MSTTHTDERQPLRCATAGSVDDGKSTLIGRLLFDAKALMTDQIAHVEAASRRRGLARADLALLTDGLRSEREQGITIDVAWRYFATPRRRFVLADSPGHVQYTRNMVTACSAADAAIVLVDARHVASGLLEQTRRHLAVTRLLGVRSVVVALNKMDAVGFAHDVFARARDEVTRWVGTVAGGRPSTLSFIPVSALHGDNVVTPSTKLPWYEGPTLLGELESLPNDDVGTSAPARLPVQWVIRPQSVAHPDYRGYAGRLASGTLRVGDEVRVLPAGLTSRIARLETARGDADVAGAGESIVVHLADHVDVSRGDLLVGVDRAPALTTQLRADVAWVHDSAARRGATYLVKHGTREVRAVLEDIEGRYDLASGELRDDAAPFGLNALGRVRFRLAEPLAIDRYDELRTTGSLLVVDPASGDTLAGAMSRGESG